MSKAWDTRRIVETRRHLRESQNAPMAMCLSPDRTECLYVMQGLYPPHTDKATVPRTGTRPPPSCGKGPNAVGESVMMLPGSPRQPAVRLTGKGSERKSWKRAAIVLRGWESQPQGERRQVRKAFDFTHVKASMTKGTSITGGNSK
jgi:hypothetical protein